MVEKKEKKFEAKVDDASQKVQSRPTKKRIRNDKGHLIGFLVASAFLVAVTVVVISNFTVISDFVVGMHYRPTPEMEQIRADLNLTGTGYRIFNASQPELKERAEFNQNCREQENETAILGCYVNEKIYVYNVVDEELPGIRELATAHELLHAVYKRMPESEKNKWNDVLASVYNENKDLLGDEIDLYSDEQKQEELYVRAGTEIKNLPDELEKHFAEIFVEQDKVVDFYESYIVIFREIEDKLEKLLLKINSLQETINAKTTAYETGVESLNSAISEFNNCAKTLNCFTSTAVFNSKRASLVAEQQRLKNAYDELSTLITDYNALVAEYNDNVLHGQMLNMTINSSVNVEAVED